eukprot:TRINITY_DN132_c0_g1_i3.p1 TRINITY_DN132_c0_g1~~TRINITY_DN132_c0_g1_i3.p1  ORF type:complete len:511 (+),score=196.85 TRINITY_DN132_c0_g1_i3:32-1534(+)
MLAISQRFAQSRGLARLFSEAYDVCVIGGGPGGYVCSIKAAQLGLKTVCIESRGTLGGTCLNEGCIPSKALLHSSHMYEQADKEFKHVGIKVDNLDIDVPQLMKNKDKVVKGLISGIESLFKANGVSYVKGLGSFGEDGKIIAQLNDGSEEIIEAKNVVIATGSKPTSIPNLEIDNEKGRIIDSTGALSLGKVPKSLVVVGGGVIGLELGSVWRRLGAEVTVVEFMDRILPTMDNEVSAATMRALKKQGMKFMLGTKVTNSNVGEDDVSLAVENVKNGKSSVLDTEVVLVSTGRRPYHDDLKLSDAGIALNERGFVDIDDHWRTNVDGVFAIGDAVPGPMLAHKAEEEGVAVANLIAGKPAHVNYDVIPGVVYTNPEVAAVGKTEEELKVDKIAYTKGSFPFLANSRAKANGETDGMVKILADKETGKVLGVHMVGSGVSEMIHEGALAIEKGLTAADIAHMCHAHPTMGEAVKEAALSTFDKAIHMPPPKARASRGKKK